MSSLHLIPDYARVARITVEITGNVYYHGISSFLTIRPASASISMRKLVKQMYAKGIQIAFSYTEVRQ